MSADDGANPVIDAYPATGYQLMALIHGYEHPGSPAVRLTFDLSTQVGPEPGGAAGCAAALRAALESLVRRHPALRTEFELADGVPALQLVRVAANAPMLTEHDLSGYTPVEAHRRLGDWRGLERHGDRRIGGLRAALHVLPRGGSTVTLDFDGPQLDSVGAALLCGELCRTYLDRLGGGQHAAPAPAPAVPRDVLALWAAADADAARARFPAGFAAGPANPGAAERVENTVVAIDASLTALLHSRAEQLRVPLEALLASVHLRVLGELDGPAHPGSWLVRDGRPAGQAAQALGEFRYALPLAVPIGSEESWPDAALRVASALDAAPHGPALPAADSVFEFRQVRIGRDVPDDPRLGAVRCRYRDRPLAPLTVIVGAAPAPTPGGLVLDVYRRDGAADVFAQGFLAALRRAVQQGSADRRRVRAPAPAAPPPPPRPAEPEPKPVHRRIFARAAQRPDATAVVAQDRTLTYAQLREHACEVAAGLTAAGVRPGDVVGLHLPRGADLVIALLGVMAAGAAFLPLDPDYPAQRSAQALADSGAAMLVVAPDVAAPGFAGPVRTLEDLADLARRTPSARPAEPSAASSAYVLFTSGSTGRPKGVEIPHRAVGTMMAWTASLFALGTRDRVAQRTSLAFDAGIWEVLAPLGAGAAVVVLPPQVNREAELLEAALVRRGITVLQLVPSLLAAHVEAGTFGSCPELRLVLCGGENLTRTLADSFAAASGADLVNVYGPAECAVDVLWERAGADADGPSVPIGRPAPGTRCHVLDEAGRPVAAGEVGELHLGGVQLGRGYRNRPGATAERFVPDHLGSRAGERLYRTGDLVRPLADGRLVFVGRVDRQVKIRGVRTEPAEIEAVLAGHRAVRRAAVAVGRTADGSAGLTAYVVPDEGAPDGRDLADALREHAAARLPEQMVPGRFVAVAGLPTLPNGKVDYHRLPRADGAPARSHRPPADPDEAWLAAQWAELLAVDAVGRFDDPFALGAGPLEAGRLAARIAERYGTAPAPSQVAAAATIPALADLIRNRE